MIPTKGWQPARVREDVPAIAILATLLAIAGAWGANATADTGASPASGTAAAKTAAASLPRLSPDSVTVERQTVALLDRLLPPRSDADDDWSAGSACLHGPGEPRWITPCIPGPPCDPSRPPHPFDLVGVRGAPTAGPVYRGPCAGRLGSHDCGPAPRLHRVPDALFDRFYRPR